MADTEGRDPLIVGTVGPVLIRSIFGIKRKERIEISDRLYRKLEGIPEGGPLVGPGSLPGVALSAEILEALRDDIIANPGISLVERSLRNAAIITAMQAGFSPPGDPIVPVMDEIQAELAEFLDFTEPQSLSLENLLGQLSQLLLNPTHTPGEPCLAPAPLLRDLLDITLGRLTGGIGAITATVAGTVKDLLLPGFAEVGELEGFIQAILDDPITAALNLVLGQQSQLDCVVEGGIGAAEGVIQTGIRRIQEAIVGAIS